MPFQVDLLKVGGSRRSEPQRLQQKITGDFAGGFLVCHVL